MMLNPGIFLGAFLLRDSLVPIPHILWLWVAAGVVSLLGNLLWTASFSDLRNREGGQIRYFIQKKFDKIAKVFGVSTVFIANGISISFFSICTTFHLLKSLKFEDVIYRIQGLPWNLKTFSNYLECGFFIAIAYLLQLLCFGAVYFMNKKPRVFSAQLGEVKIIIMLSFLIMGTVACFNGTLNGAFYEEQVSTGFLEYLKAFFTCLFCIHGFTNVSTHWKLVKREKGSAILGGFLGCLYTAILFLTINLSLYGVLSSDKIKSSGFFLASAYVFEITKSPIMSSITDLLISIFFMLQIISFHVTNATNATLLLQSLLDIKLELPKESIYSRLGITGDFIPLAWLVISVFIDSCKAYFDIAMVIFWIFNVFHAVCYLLNRYTYKISNILFIFCAISIVLVGISAISYWSLENWKYSIFVLPSIFIAIAIVFLSKIFNKK